MATPSSTELPIQEATLELIRWFIPLLHRLPRLHPAEAARANLRSWKCPSGPLPHLAPAPPAVRGPAMIRCHFRTSWCGS
jgi:hypothetical protein